MIKKIFKFWIVFLLIYPIGVFLTIVLLSLLMLRFLRIINWKRFPHYQTGMVVIFNHPSIIDQFIVAMLFFKGFLVNPIKYSPLIVADANNFYNSWYFFWLRRFMISVDRGNKESEKLAFLRMTKEIKNGRILIIAPEGGRTFRGEEVEFLYSPKGNKIRGFKNGIGLLVRKTKAKMLLLWFEGTDKFFLNSKDRLFSFRIRNVGFFLKIGEVFYFGEEDLRRCSTDQITKKIADRLLALADE